MSYEFVGFYLDLQVGDSVMVQAGGNPRYAVIQEVPATADPERVFVVAFPEGETGQVVQIVHTPQRRKL